MACHWVVAYGHNLSEGIEGIVSKSAECTGSRAALQELGQALLTNQVPVAWNEQWPGPEEALAYCAATAHRAASVSAWVAAMQAGSLWTSPLNLAHLFNPGQPSLIAC